MDLYDGCPDIVTTVSPAFKKFWDTIWQELLQEFKNEDYK